MKKYVDLELKTPLLVNLQIVLSLGRGLESEIGRNLISMMVW